MPSLLDGLLNMMMDSTARFIKLSGFPRAIRTSEGEESASSNMETRTGNQLVERMVVRMYIFNLSIGEFQICYSRFTAEKLKRKRYSRPKYSIAIILEKQKINAITVLTKRIIFLITNVTIMSLN
jgi:hypothetical protein